MEGGSSLQEIRAVDLWMAVQYLSWEPLGEDRYATPDGERRADDAPYLTSSWDWMLPHLPPGWYVFRVERLDLWNVCERRWPYAPDRIWAQHWNGPLAIGLALQAHAQGQIHQIPLDPKNPWLYIDVDGVLNGTYEGWVQLRPNAIGFLRWCTEHFNCFWLTRWPKSERDRLLRLLYASDLIPKIRETPYTSSKVDALDLTQDFYWIEDGILPDEQARLDSLGKGDRYLAVHAEGKDELDRIQGELRKILVDRIKERLQDRHRRTE